LITRLETMFSKRQTLRKSHVSHTHHHAHTPPQPQAHHEHSAHHATRTHATHAHHAQTHHAFSYANVYSCTNCGRKGHSAKFCYDRINASNDRV